MITRKTLTSAAVLVGVLGFALAPPAEAQVVQTLIKTNKIPQFVDPLPLLVCEVDLGPRRRHTS